MDLISGRLLHKGKDIERLLQDTRIIRNRLKVHAAIANAKKILELRKEFGSFKAWLDHHHPLDKAGWVKLFKTFRFSGGEIVNEFLMSTGYLPARMLSCSVYRKITQIKTGMEGEILIRKIVITGPESTGKEYPVPATGGTLWYLMGARICPNLPGSEGVNL